MLSDVIDLRDFYSTGLGGIARHAIGRAVGGIWPDLSGRTVLGVGYATPYLSQFRGQARTLVAVMPDRIGVLPWPNGGPNATCLAGEADLPLPDLSMERILLAHCLEASENVPSLLREIWRVMDDGGRLLLLVPNRGGIWARTDRTPFGSGQPFSIGQINRILRDAMFTPLQSVHALFVPPTHRRFLLAAAPAIENIGRRWLKPLGGVSLIEASKTIYAGTPVSRRATMRKYITVGAAARVADRTPRQGKK